MRRLYQASTLLDFLHSVGVRPKKGLSQNFLVDGNVVSKIVDAAGVCEGDLILEIGPGPGVLTEEILLRGASVLAIEKDRVLGPALQRLCEDTDRLTVITGDALEQDFAALLKQKLKPGQRAKVVANLPYQITTPLLVALAPLTDSVSDIVVMVQDEFARRATASPGSREIGSLTIFLEYYSDCRYAFKVGKNCFYPVPKVDSAILHARLVPARRTDVDPDAFFRLTRTAFQQRRKMLRRSLRELYAPEHFDASCQACGIDPSLRPEQLGLEQWLALYFALERA